MLARLRRSLLVIAYVGQRLLTTTVVSTRCASPQERRGLVAEVRRSVRLPSNQGVARDGPRQRRLLLKWQYCARRSNNHLTSIVSQHSREIIHLEIIQISTGIYCSLLRGSSSTCVLLLLDDAEPCQRSRIGWGEWAWSFFATSTAYIVLEQVIIRVGCAAGTGSLPRKRIQEKARLELLHRLESPVTNPLPRQARMEATAGGHVGDGAVQERVQWSR